MTHQWACRAASPHGQTTNAPDHRTNAPPGYPTPTQCVKAGVAYQADDPTRFPNVHRAVAPLLEARFLWAVASRSRPASRLIVLEARDAARRSSLRSLLWRARGRWTDGRG